MIETALKEKVSDVVCSEGEVYQCCRIWNKGNLQWKYCAIYNRLIMQSGTELCQTIGHIFSFNFAKWNISSQGL